jgi:N-acetylglucosamine-6-sulfatase
MRRVIALLASVTLAVVLLSGAYREDGVPTAEAQIAPNPNFVFILVDDMRKDDLRYMPKTRSLLAQRGMSFNNAYVSNALCCPSRATTMRGQYAHNSGVWINTNSSNGGWEAYKSKGYEQDNVATRLHDAGYRTALIGKYINQYQGTSKPAGWDKWFVTYGYNFFNYDINDNGTVRHYGGTEGDYLTDVLKRQTQTFIDTSAAQGNPFFAYVAPIAPHHPATPAPRHAHTYDGAKAPRLPSFNEANVSDKPPWIRSLPRLTATQIANIDNRHERRIESLQAVDGLVEGVVNKLRAEEALRNTYIFFTTDNGWHHGEHRIPQEKWRPYEEPSHVPLLVRGPGVGAGSTTPKLALNTDFFPTFTTLAGIPTPSYVDGRSLRPVLRGSATAWRSAILLEAARRTSIDGRDAPAYYGIRTSDRRKYIEYASGHRELYNLGADPYERFNNYNTAAPPRDLASRLQALKSCRPEPKDIDSTTVPCRTAEGGQ